MATVENQQSWLPYDGSNYGCSQGFCNIHCPQWCYRLPPPPPPPIAGADDESGAAMSPFIITIITILATALLLVSYYILISKYRTAFSFHRRLQETDAAAFSAGGRREECRSSQSDGLKEALINTVWRYKREEGLVEGTDCSVCLTEFSEDDSLRLLPKCEHAFHLQCIDTWLKSHPNCPLCRNNVMPAVPAAPEPESMAATALEIVVILENTERRDEEEGDHGTNIS